MRGIHNTWASLAAFATVGILVCFETAKADGPGWGPLFGDARLDPALRDIRTALSSTPNDSRVLARLGDVLFRRANFEVAEEAYQAALRLNRNEARGYWGLGRLASLNSRAVEAERRFEEAFARNPRDPEIILSYADYVPATDMRTELWQEFLENSDPSDIQRREDVAARLILANRLDGRLPMQLAAGAGQPHRIPAISLGTSSGLRGLVLNARINGSKPIRLLLDSGAEGIYVNRRTARKLNLELLVETRVGGLGSSTHANGQMGLASRLTMENLEFENTLVRVLDLEWLSDADGVIGTDVFKDFLLRIDPRRHAVDLKPYPETPLPGASKMYRMGHQLLLHGSANGRAQGYFLLDTGASASLLSKAAATTVLPNALSLDNVLMRGVRGELPGIAAPARVSVAGREWNDPEAIAVDLEHLSRQTGVELLGVLGFPLLSQAAITIDYRDGLVAFERY